jgi:hypothetical protein
MHDESGNSLYFMVISNNFMQWVYHVLDRPATELKPYISKS